MKSSVLENIFLTLPAIADFHAPSGAVYQWLKKISRQEIEKLFAEARPRTIQLKPFGKLLFPYHKMGNVDSLNLFDFDELIIFSFYWLNRHRYRRVADIGANIGLHSILLERCGFKVRAYEPDPEHFKIFQRNLKLNKCSQIEPLAWAVSNKSGEAEFVRVLGNTTGNHIAGSKPNLYGELEKIQIRTKPIQPIIKWADFLKIDVEGHEKEILLATTAGDWRKSDALVEIGNEENARQVFRHFKKTGINLFAQKINWQPVRKPAEMPFSYRDGSLFISRKNKMPWQEK